MISKGLTTQHALSSMNIDGKENADRGIEVMMEQVQQYTAPVELHLHRENE